MRSMIVAFAVIVVVAVGVTANNEKYQKTALKDIHNLKFDSVKPGVNVTNFALKSNDCWTCGYPCESIYCCDDGNPQCCQVSGMCACCAA
ncbi:unnamed protein product [Medioppia subpectinata]|uniref:Uncharacterized protein n=1 Tax=Medioppia subpectinata TaxID=1979941 RepID=A0A7R9Q2X7_9ACAR|nr:unnamed protein product [Medioppia subpectinata]CAG2109892.1 unnamed protein product [Medioppia subpectinata]